MCITVSVFFEKSLDSSGLTVFCTRNRFDMPNTRNIVSRDADMLRVLTILVAGLLVSGCLFQTNALRPTENGVWLGVKNTSYDKIMKAANTVMARHFEVTRPDPEMGTIVGQDFKYELSFTKKVKFFVWPTENSDASYSVDGDSFQGRTWFKDEVD